MNASGRRCREFNNGFAKFAVLCGKSFRGGRPVYHATAGTSIADAIARERAAARRQAAIKAKK